MNLIELTAKYPTDEAAAEWFIAQRWPDGVECPDCGSVERVVGASHRSMPFWCGACRAYFSVKKGTLMESSKLGCRQWLVAIYLISQTSKGISSVQLAKDLGISQKSAWHLAHRIRQAWADDTDPLFTGPVEIDEVYVGGLEHNRHQSKRGRHRGGGMGKTSVMGVFDRPTGKVSARVVPRVTSGVTLDFLKRRVHTGARVFSDGAGRYQHVQAAGWEHDTVLHSKGEYVRGDIHTNAIESLWATIRRGYVGIYHYMSPKHLHRYTAEFAGRWNDRYNRRDMASVFHRMIGKRLKLADLTNPDPISAALAELR